MAERKPGQREEQQRADMDTAVASAGEEAVDTANVDTANDARREAAQSAELNRDLLESQTELAEVAVRTVESATDVGTMSTRVWASLGSAWVGLMQTQMQFTLENLNRLRETHGLTRPLEAQARFLRETIHRPASQQQEVRGTLPS